MKKHRFVFEAGDKSKFWEIEVKGSVVHVLYGRVGTDGRTSDKPMASPSAAEKHAEKLIASKVKKGYEPVGKSTRPTKKSATKKSATKKSATKKSATKKSATKPSRSIAAAVEAWRAFAAKAKKNPHFQVNFHFGTPATEPALKRIQKAWGDRALPASLVEFLRVVDGFDFEVRQADGKTTVFVDGLGQDPPEHHF